jgi:hypothetical protein
VSRHSAIKLPALTIAGGKSDPSLFLVSEMVWKWPVSSLGAVMVDVFIANMSAMGV